MVEEYKALPVEYKPLESQNATDTLLASTHTRYKSIQHITNLLQSRFVNIQQSWSLI